MRERTSIGEGIMNKSLPKELRDIVETLNHDYLTGVKYVIYITAKIIYESSTPDFSHIKPNLFSEYEFFDLRDAEAEKKITDLLTSAVNKINSKSFRPAELYERLLTPREKKELGQVYTPYEIIDKMLDQAFELKAVNENIKILDPSCGGGYFLIKAFEKLRTSLGDTVDDRYIAENMLYGVDVDEFSVFLTKAGLLFVSGSRRLSFNIHCFDFLTDLNNLGRFDIIVGNPPYVGHKNSSAQYRKELYEKYPEVFYDKADISYCFFKKGMDSLREAGIISFITSRYFMEALYARGLRAYIKNNFSILSIFDFDGGRVFKGAMVSPAVVTLTNIGWNKKDFSYVKYNEGSLKESFVFPQEKLRDQGWIILRDEDDNLFNRIHDSSNAYIKDVCTLKQGIITGLDKAFIVDEAAVEKYGIESALLKKWIKNSSISRDYIKYNNLYLIYSNIIDNEQDYPNAIKYLSEYKDRLQRRRECIRGYRKWYELQWGRVQSDFENPKIVFPYKSSGNNFYYDENEYFCSADIYLMNGFPQELSLEYLLKYLNSDIFEFYFKCGAKKVGNNTYEYYPNKLNYAKIFLPQENNQKNISDLGKINIEIFLKKVFNITEEEVKNIIYKFVYKG